MDRNTPCTIVFIILRLVIASETLTSFVVADCQSKLHSDNVSEEAIVNSIY